MRWFWQRRKPEAAVAEAERPAARRFMWDTRLPPALEWPPATPEPRGRSPARQPVSGRPASPWRSPELF